MHPYLRVANVFEDRIDTSDVMSMNFDPGEYQRFVLQPGDILLNEGQSKELVGRSAIYGGESPGACFTNSLVRFRANEVTTPAFAQALFKHYLRNGYFQSIAKITTNIAHLGKERFAALDFPLPPLNEQKRIVAQIEALQARSSAAQEALDTIPPLLEKFRQSVLAAAFRGDLTKKWREAHPDTEPATELLARIRAERRRRWEEANPKKKYVEPEPVDTTGLPELPEGWCWATVDEVSTNHDSRRIPVRQGDRSSRPGPYPYYGAFGVIDHVEDFIFDGTFTLVAEDGKNLLQRRRPIALVAAGKFWVNNHAHILEPLCGIPHRYLSEYFNSKDLGQYLTGIDQVKLTRGALDKVPIPIAPLCEQEVIVANLNEALAVLGQSEERANRQTALLQQLNQSILAKAFRGELVPQDPNDEPASVLLERIRQARDAHEATAEKPRRGRKPKPAQ